MRFKHLRQEFKFLDSKVEGPDAGTLVETTRRHQHIRKTTANNNLMLNRKANILNINTYRNTK